MTQTIAAPADLTDFAEPAKQIEFTVGADRFVCPSSLPVLTLIDVAESADAMDETAISEMRPLFRRLFSMILVPESAERFLARMGDRTCRECGSADAAFDSRACPACEAPLPPPPADPIGLEVVQNVIPWVMEQYGLRPTEPSGNSSDGQPSPPSGPNSTVTAPGAELTSADLPSTAS